MSGDRGLGTAFEKEVWKNAVAEAEAAVLSAAPSLGGGLRNYEKAEHYAARGIAVLNEQLTRLKMAREKYAEVLQNVT